MANNTQYSIALHLMVGLAAVGGEVPSRALAHSINTSPSFVRRILAKLSKAGLVRTSTGNDGSCALGKDMKDISLLNIYEAVEAPKAFTIHTYDVQKGCQISGNIKAVQEKTLGKAQKALENTLAEMSLGQFLSELKSEAKKNK